MPKVACRAKPTWGHGSAGTHSCYFSALRWRILPVNWGELLIKSWLAYWPSTLHRQYPFHLLRVRRQ